MLYGFPFLNRSSAYLDRILRIVHLLLSRKAARLEDCLWTNDIEVVDLHVHRSCQALKEGFLDIC